MGQQLVTHVTHPIFVTHLTYEPRPITCSALPLVYAPRNQSKVIEILNHKVDTRITLTLHSM